MSALPILSSNMGAGAWKVLSLFIIPIGGGIPAGVLLAKTYHLPWFITTFLYFISDLLLAIVFEPILLLAIHYGKRIPRLAHASIVMKEMIKRTTEHYGTST